MKDQLSDSIGLQSGQLALWDDVLAVEDPEFLSRHLITYIGNKRSLLRFIGRAVEQVKLELGRDKLDVFDAFSGSGVVSRFFKAHAARIVSNDLEAYAAAVARCFLTNKSAVDYPLLGEVVAELNSRVSVKSSTPGFIEELYSPRDEENISSEDRVFYTRENARRLDSYRQLLDTVPDTIRHLLMGPLLSKASVHANTAGVFKGFYKDRRTGIGRFGGSGADALTRIKGLIAMEVPVLSNFECEFEVHQEDANALAGKLKGLDLAYIDPPYNQHPYGSNYFMLNLLLKYERPKEVSRVSGIPADWQRSGYNVRSKAMSLLRDLLEKIDSSYLLISFSNEGFIKPGEMVQMLNAIGDVRVFESRYNAFRGCRNFDGRSIHVTEQLFLVRKR